MKIAIVTGASSGMGREFVREINKKYTDLQEIWVIARRKDRLKTLKEAYGDRIRVLPLDLVEEGDQLKIKEILKKEAPKISILVNAAGIGMIGKVRDLSEEDEREMVRINVEALTVFTCICLPYMARGGRIINLSSSAAYMPQPGFAVYAATKSYVLSFSRALKKELLPYGISVTAVCPGPVRTEFYSHAERHYKIPDFKKQFLADPKAVVALAMKDAAKRKDVSIYSLSLKLGCLMTKIIPHSLLIKFWK